ncbi:MAG: LacI family DNA-binding transcriptional regulator [Spirochaetales bacterium]
MKKAALTLKDIADQLGISPATVSLALRNKECVAEKTRQMVWEAAKRSGYVYNRSAARLRTQRSTTIGLIVPTLLNPFFTELTSAVEEKLDSFGYSLLLAKTSEDRNRQGKALRTMLEYSVDGILLCPALGTTQEDLRICEKANTPLVLFTRPVDGARVDYVGPENGAGTSMAARYLLGKGHERIAFIGGTPGSFTRWERFEGYRKALEDAHVPVNPSYTKTCESTLDGGFQAIQELLMLEDRPSAAVCFNDVIAFGVILGLWAHRILPGKEFGVIGFDNLSDAALFSPALTTLSCPPRRIGHQASELLLERIEHPERKPVTNILVPELILRDSA